MEKLRIFYLYLTVFVTGAAVLIVEILGTRILAPFYGSTIYVWSSLITVTLAGLALGYFLGGKTADKKDPLKFLYAMILIAGILIILIPLYSEKALLFSNKLGIKYGPLLSSLLLFSPPLFALGTIAPLAVKSAAQRIENLGVTAGNLYAAATVGSLVGGLLTGFYLAPNYTAKVITTTTGIVLVAIYLLWQLISGNPASFLLGVVFIILTGAIFPSQFWGLKNSQNLQKQHPVLLTSKGQVEAKIIYKQPSIYGDIVVFDYLDRVRCFLIDGTNESCWNFESGRPSIYVQNTNLFLQALGRERNIKDILVIGIGAGTLLKELDGSGYSVDGVELNPKMLEVAETYFPQPKNLNYRIFIDDGRHYLNSSDKKYDVIVLDICYVNEHNVHLWTKEFYALTKGHLKNPGKGIIIASYGVVAKNPLSERLDHMIANAMKESFSQVYTAMREEIRPEEFDMAIFLATDQPVAQPIEQPKLTRWVFNTSILPTSDEKTGEMLKLFLPATEKIREQALRNFGEKLLLPI